MFTMVYSDVSPDKYTLLRIPVIILGGEGLIRRGLAPKPAWRCIGQGGLPLGEGRCGGPSERYQRVPNLPPRLEV